MLAELKTDPDRMRSTLEATGHPAEQQSMVDLAGGTAAGDYLGATSLIIDTALERADNLTKDSS